MTASYLSQLTREPLLTAEEERSLARQAQAGDREARDRMVRANLGLVGAIAKSPRFQGRGLSFDDLFSEGVIGLIHAVGRFNPDRGIRFTTYASHWVKQTISRAITNTGDPIRKPAFIHGWRSKWHKAARRLGNDLGRAPTDAEVGRAIGLKPKQAEILRHSYATDALADWPDDHPAGREHDPANAAETADDLRQLDAARRGLTDTEDAVLASLYGLDGETVRDGKSVARERGVTRQAVFKAKLRAVARLAEAFA